MFGSRFAPLAVVALPLAAGCVPQDPDPPGEAYAVARFEFDPLAPGGRAEAPAFRQDDPRPATFRAVELNWPFVYALTREGELFTFEAGGGAAREFFGGVREGVLERRGATFSSPLQLPAFMAAIALPDARKPAPLRPLSRTPAAGDGNDLELVGDALLLSDRGGLRVWDLTDPAAPRGGRLVQRGGPFFTSAAVRAGDTLYLLGDGRIRGFDIGDPAAPEPAGEWETDGANVSGGADGRFLYVSQRARREVDCEAGVSRTLGGRTGVAVLDRRDPAELPEVAFAPLAEAPYHLFPAGRPGSRLLVACDGGAGGGGYSGSGGRVKVNLRATATVFAVAADGSLTEKYRQDRAGGRAAAWSPRGGGRLACDGLVYRVGADAMTLAGAFRPVSGTLDGSPYHGAAAGGRVALAALDAVTVVRLGASAGHVLGRAAARVWPAFEPLPAVLARAADRFLYAPPSGTEG